MNWPWFWSSVRLWSFLAVWTVGVIAQVGAVVLGPDATFLDLARAMGVTP